MLTVIAIAFSLPKIDLAERGAEKEILITARPARHRDQPVDDFKDLVEFAKLSQDRKS